MSTSSKGGEDGERQAHPVTTVTPRNGAAPDFGSFMRQVFPDGSGDGGATVTALWGALPPALVRRDYDVALTLVKRAAEAIPALLRHCQQLETDLRRIRAEAAADLEAANGEVQQWQQIAVAMKMHIEENEHEIALMRKRVMAAEERLTTGHTIAQQQAHRAMEITTMFHDKIVDAFGVGSPAHAALDAAQMPDKGDQRGR